MNAMHCNSIKVQSAPEDERSKEITNGTYINDQFRLHGNNLLQLPLGRHAVMAVRVVMVVMMYMVVIQEY